MRLIYDAIEVGCVFESLRIPISIINPSIIFLKEDVDWLKRMKFCEKIIGDKNPITNIY